MANKKNLSGMRSGNYVKWQRSAIFCIFFIFLLCSPLNGAIQGEHSPAWPRTVLDRKSVV